jgi:hypothetical protein
MEFSKKANFEIGDAILFEFIVVMEHPDGKVSITPFILSVAHNYAKKNPKKQVYIQVGTVGAFTTTTKLFLMADTKFLQKINKYVSQTVSGIMTSLNVGTTKLEMYIAYTNGDVPFSKSISKEFETHFETFKETPFYKNGLVKLSQTEKSLNTLNDVTNLLARHFDDDLKKQMNVQSVLFQLKGGKYDIIKSKKEKYEYKDMDFEDTTSS